MSKNLDLYNYFEKIPENEPIFASYVYMNNSTKWKITENSYYKILERLVSSKQLFRVTKGVYVKPKQSRFGVVLPNDRELAEFLSKENKGVIVGYHLYNRLGLTTQKSKTYRVYCKQSYCKATIRNIKLSEYSIEYTRESKKMIEFLEVLSEVDKIQDLNEKQFINYCKNFSLNDYSDENLNKVLEKIKYKKSTLYFLKKILTFYGIAHTVDLKLSNLSKYKTPNIRYYETPR